MLKLLLFSVQNVLLCMDFQYIERVLPLPWLEKVPDSPRYLAGLMNLRGKSIPIIDLALRLGLTRQESYSLNIPILLCGTQEKQAGFIIDQIYGMEEVNASDIQKLEDLQPPFIGSVTLGANVSLLIDTTQLLSFAK